jgi:hypothetical protein
MTNGRHKSRELETCYPKNRMCRVRRPRLQLKMSWLALCLAVVASLQAQQPAPPVSPEVYPDGRVTFRIRAPKASKVEVSGDWKPGQLEEMTKDADGVWSATLGPFEPASTSIRLRWTDWPSPIL